MAATNRKAAHTRINSESCDDPCDVAKTSDTPVLTGHSHGELTPVLRRQYQRLGNKMELVKSESVKKSRYSVAADSECS